MVSYVLYLEALLLALLPHRRHCICHNLRTMHRDPQLAQALRRDVRQASPGLRRPTPFMHGIQALRMERNNRIHEWRGRRLAGPSSQLQPSVRHARVDAEVLRRSGFGDEEVHLSCATQARAVVRAYSQVRLLLLLLMGCA